ncbi:MAG: DUF3124 domain-containing protein [Xenococcaceae cyanobacterium]
MTKINRYSWLVIAIAVLAMGQTIYVPVYSHIYYLNHQKEYNLATTLSIRNTDLTHAITIEAVNYYDSDGQLVRQYIEDRDPLLLSPLGSTDFFVGVSDKTGGVGANFLVEWKAGDKVTEPIVEAVMIGTAGTQGISFTSPGRVIGAEN